MSASVEKIKELRAATGAGILECRKVLEETNGDIKKAISLLKKRGLAKAAKRAGREAHEGIIGSYVHGGAQVAAIVEVNCETDFVARTSEFQQLAKDLAMQVVAMQPRYLSEDNIPADVLEEKKSALGEDLRQAGKPDKIIERAVEGRLKKYYEEVCLLRQPFFRDNDVTVHDVIQANIAKLGENIVVRRFVRYEVGQ